MERIYDSIETASEDSLLVQKGYESRIIRKEEIVFCEIIDRKIYLNLTSDESQIAIRINALPPRRHPDSS